jgi:Na+-transporting methylmalonyl-CoA/oxaloacetate decarboxylase gamma subunit
MNLLEQLNTCCRRLWRDESGVVLAFTVIVFLSLFVIACSVYAVGENIRQRIELQNAADAAAYSAAVVQADALSRVAAINKAMAWTYVQMGRDQMNYILHSWLREVITEYDQDDANRAAIVGRLYNGVNNFHDQMQPKDSWIGCSKTLPNVVWLNKQNWVPIGDIRNAVTKYYTLYLPKDTTEITQDIIDINDMKDYEVGILSNLPHNISKTVQFVLQADVKDTFNDSRSVFGSADFRFALIQSEAPLTEYCELYQSEDQFLAAANAESQSFGVGHNSWFPAQPKSGGTWERYRDYEQQANCLIAEWRYYVEGWQTIQYCYDKDCPCGDHGRAYAANWFSQTYTPHLESGDGRGVVAESVRDDYFKTIVLEPQNLKRAYFGQAGGLVLGVARRMNNPLTFMGADASQLGLYNFFSSGGARYAWAVAASRAGYRSGNYEGGQKNQNYKFGGEGEYYPFLTDGSNWGQTGQQLSAVERNLSEVDWDGVLVALHSIWGANGNGTSILQELWSNAPWQKLSGGGTVNGLQALDGAKIQFTDESAILH